MSYTPIGLATGINPNTDFLLKLDTEQRMKNVFSDFKQPIQYSVPTGQAPDPRSGLSQSAIFNEGDRNKIIKDALASPDFGVRQKAYDALFKGISTQPLEKGVGQYKFTPYYPWQDKFLNDEFGYNPNLTQAQNEKYYYDNQYEIKSAGGKLVSNVSKFIGRVLPQAALKLGEGFGYVGAMVVGAAENLGDAITGKDNHNFMATVSENAFSRKLEELEQDLKNTSLLSVYKPEGWDKMSFLTKLKYGSMWTDEIADGVSFLVSAAIPGAFAGKIGDGVSLLSRSSKIWNASMRFLGTETLGDVGSVLYNTTMESAMESAEGFKKYKEELVQKRDSGDPQYANLTDKEIDEMAGNVAAARFNANMVILTASNLFENKFIFKPLAKKLAGESIRTSERIGARAAMDEIGRIKEVEASKNWFKKFVGIRGNQVDGMARIPFYGKRFLKASFMEGMWEENAQLAAERWSSQAPYTNTQGDTVHPEKNLFRQYLRQSEDAFSGDDRENETSIGLGALIGIFGTGIVGKAFGGSDAHGNMAFWKGERKTQIDQSKESIKRYNTAYHNMLGLNDIFKTDDTGKKVIDEVKVAEKVKALQDYGMEQLSANDIKDDIFREKIQQDLFARYIAAAVRADVHEGLIGRLSNMRHIPEEKLEALGLNTKEIFGSPEKYAARGKELISEYQKIDQTFSAKPKDRTFQDHEEQEANRKYAAFMSYARMRSSQDAQEKYKEQVAKYESEIKDHFSPLVNEYPLHMTQLSEYNKLVLEQEALEKTTEEFEFFGHEDMLKETKQRIKQIEEQKEAIKKQIDSNPEVKDRIKERGIKDSARKLLIDTKVDTAVGLIHDNLLHSVGKTAQLFIDVTNNKILYEKLKDEKSGAEAYDNYETYLAKRKTAETLAETNPDTAIIEEENKRLEERKAANEEILAMPADGTVDDEELKKDQDIINTLLNANKEAVTVTMPHVIEPITEEEFTKTVNDRINDIETRRKAELDEEFTQDEEGIYHSSRNSGKTLKELKENIKDSYEVELQNVRIYVLEQSAHIIAPSTEGGTSTFVDVTSTENTPTSTIFFQTGDNTRNTLDEYDDENRLKYSTPLVTVTKQADDELNEAGTDTKEDVEVLHPNSYVSALNESIHKAIDLTLYEPIIVKDRPEWFNRFGLSQQEELKADPDKIGVVLVFRKKGTTDQFLKIGDQVKGSRFKEHANKIIAHSLDDPTSSYGFNMYIGKRAEIKAREHHMSLDEVYKFYRDQQDLSNLIRLMLVDGEIDEYHVTIERGGNGIIPVTKTSEFVNIRFKNFGVKYVLITKENIDKFPGATEGTIYATFPGKVSQYSQTKFFPVTTTSIFGITTIDHTNAEDLAIATKIKNAVENIITGKLNFETKASAIALIRQFLEKVIYTSEGKSELKIVFRDGKYFIEHYTANKEGEMKKSTSSAQIKLNVDNRIYNGVSNLFIPDSSGILEEVSNKTYVNFIENRFKTYRKVVKTVSNQLFLDPMNAYYNLTDMQQPEKVKTEEVSESEPPVIETPKEEKKDEGISSEDKAPEDVVKAPLTIAEARAKLDELEKKGEEKPSATTYTMFNMIIDLERIAFSYIGSQNPKVKQATIDSFIINSAKMQAEQDPAIIFGQYETKKTSKVYFFGNKNIGTFVLFDDKLNQIKNEEKFAKENPEIYEEIQNKCK